MDKGVRTSAPGQAMDGDNGRVVVTAAQRRTAVEVCKAH
jgi:hypothetical protein